MAKIRNLRWRTKKKTHGSGSGACWKQAVNEVMPNTRIDAQSNTFLSATSPSSAVKARRRRTSHKHAPFFDPHNSPRSTLPVVALFLSMIRHPQEVHVSRQRDYEW